jgi:hypothetical protein
MAAVWRHANVNGSTLVVLLAMADWADDDGLGVYPKRETLARKSRMSKRNVRYVLDELETAGYIKRVGKRAGNVIEWRVETDVAKIATLQSVAIQECNGLQPDTSIDPSAEAIASEGTSEDDHDSSEPKGEEGADERPHSGGGRYAEPASPGAAAAPWLVIELARLMRANDEKVKLPVGLRELMAPEYIDHYVGALGGGFASAEKRRELVAPVADKPGLKTWLDAMRLLVDADERPVREVAQVVRWCQADSFWKANVLSADKFRKQYPKLRARWLEEGGASGVLARGGTQPRPPVTSAQMDALARRNA